MELSADEKKALSLAVRNIKHCKDRIAQARDELRSLIDQVEEIIGCGDKAVEGLDTAIDALSEYL